MFTPIPISGLGGGGPANPLQIVAAAATDEGLVRLNNEDSYTLLPNKQLYVVADGMGGHRAGEIASRMAVDIIGRMFQTQPGAEIDQRTDMLQTAVELASELIFNRAAGVAEYLGMGTTVVALHLDEIGGWFCAAHVGDSRLYRLRRGQLDLLTRDHSEANRLFDMGCTPDFVAANARKNVITRAVGYQTVEADVTKDRIEDGDLFLLCSDGLTGVVSDGEIQKILIGREEMRPACEDLVDAAFHGGAPDNVTILLVRVFHP